MNLPDDVAAGVARGVGAYIRSTSMADLPGPLKRFKRFATTDKGLAPHRAGVLGTLEDEPTRALIKEWLDGKPRLPKEEAELLRLATARPDQWEQQLAGRARQPSAPPSQDARLQESLDREREKTRKAREEARHAKEEARSETTRARARISELESEMTELRSRIETIEAERDAARRDLAQATEDSASSLRRARRDVERSRLEVDELRRELRAEKKRTTAREEPAPPRILRPRATPARPSEPDSVGPRVPLAAPLGRLADEPETLLAWLDAPEVRLLVDGYNVAKAEGGYGDLELASQRERVVDGIARLARKKKVETTIVFDGSEVPAGTARRRRGLVRVEYSAAGEIADDHLIALLEKLPPQPVVVVTNDRELQERAAVLGATGATSEQLLALIR